jgi:hypothetical protein
MATKLSDAQIKKAARQGGENELMASKGPTKAKMPSTAPKGKFLPYKTGKMAKSK